MLEIGITVYQEKVQAVGMAGDGSQFSFVDVCAYSYGHNYDIGLRQFETFLQSLEIII